MDPAVQTSVLSVIALIACFTVSLLVCCCCARFWGRRRYQPTSAAEINRPLHTGRGLPGRAERLQQSIGRFSASIRRKFRRQRSINRALTSGDACSNGGGGGIDTTGGLTLNPSVYHRMETGHYNTAFESCYAEEERPAWLSGPVGNGFSNGAGGAGPQYPSNRHLNSHDSTRHQLQLHQLQHQQHQQLARPDRQGRRQNESAV
ncbi:hypothetical protein BOX15_Mlig015614g1 [Macrostomum lignano]|uniref:Uncharacterized protein n=2 Tax=Macrostomum lignano TaxID=282301 RepID=A0A267GHB6_9PLAT|nr:hypothetical protein BOX15_Mlig015614g1 [Macrostomum lignano]